MSVLAFVGGVVIGGAAMALTRIVKGRRKPTEQQVIEFANTLDAIERATKPHGLTIGYSIDVETGGVDVTLRVANVGEDIVFRFDKLNVQRKPRSVTETLGIAKELPPSLGGATQIGGDQ
jgi:hypothetical protein